MARCMMAFHVLRDHFRAAEMHTYRLLSNIDDIILLFLLQSAQRKKEKIKALAEIAQRR